MKVASSWNPWKGVFFGNLQQFSPQIRRQNLTKKPSFHHLDIGSEVSLERFCTHPSRCWSILLPPRTAAFFLAAAVFWSHRSARDEDRHPSPGYWVGRSDGIGRFGRFCGRAETKCSWKTWSGREDGSETRSFCLFVLGSLWGEDWRNSMALFALDWEKTWKKEDYEGVVWVMYIFWRIIYRIQLHSHYVYVTYVMYIYIYYTYTYCFSIRIDVCVFVYTNIRCIYSYIYISCIS